MAKSTREMTKKYQTLKMQISSLIFSGPSFRSGLSWCNYKQFLLVPTSRSTTATLIIPCCYPLPHARCATIMEPTFTVIHSSTDNFVQFCCLSDLMMEFLPSENQNKCMQKLYSRYENEKNLVWWCMAFIPALRGRGRKVSVNSKSVWSMV